MASELKKLTDPSSVAPDDIAVLRASFPNGNMPTYRDRKAMRARGYNFMIACDLDKFYPYKNNDILSIAKYIKQECKELLSMWAYCKHKDTRHDHVVLALHYKNAKTVLAVARMFHVPVYLVKLFKGNMNTMFSYLTHETDGAREVKEVIPVSAVVASFDYQALIDRARKFSEIHENKYMKMIKSYAKCELTKSELQDRLGPIAYLKYLPKIGMAKRTRADFKHNTYLKEMDGGLVKTLVLGDTYSANTDLANLMGDDYFDLTMQKWHKLYSHVRPLDPVFENKRIKKKIAKAFVRLMQSSYYEPDPAYNYWELYEGQYGLICDYDEFLQERDTKQHRLFDGLMTHWINEPADPNYHDVWATMNGQKIPINCKYLVLLSNDLNPNGIRPFDTPPHVLYIGTTDQYIKLIKKFSLDKIDPDLSLTNLNINQNSDI